MNSFSFTFQSPYCEQRVEWHSFKIPTTTCCAGICVLPIPRAVESPCFPSTFLPRTVHDFSMVQLNEVLFFPASPFTWRCDICFVESNLEILYAHESIDLGVRYHLTSHGLLISS
jgi:hypothetical protein